MITGHISPILVHFSILKSESPYVTGDFIRAFFPALSPHFFQVCFLLFSLSLSGQHELLNHKSHAVVIIGCGDIISGLPHRENSIFHSHAQTGILNHSQVIVTVAAGIICSRSSPSTSSRRASDRALSIPFGMISRKYGSERYTLKSRPMAAFTLGSTVTR